MGTRVILGVDFRTPDITSPGSAPDIMIIDQMTHILMNQYQALWWRAKVLTFSTIPAHQASEEPLALTLEEVPHFPPVMYTRWDEPGEYLLTVMLSSVIEAGRSKQDLISSIESNDRLAPGRSIEIEIWGLSDLGENSATI